MNKIHKTGDLSVLLRYKLIFKLVNDKYILFESVEPTEEDIIFISTCSTDEYPTMSEYL